MVCHFRCGCGLQSTVWPLSTDSLQATDRGLWFRHPDHKPQDPTPGIEYQIRISNTRALSLKSQTPGIIKYQTPGIMDTDN